MTDGRAAGQGAALVTGASRGIGRAIAERLAAGGIHVVNLDREPGESLANSTTYRVDLADAARTEAVLREVAARHRVTRLVNNAGFLVPASLDETTAEDWRRTVQVNLHAALQCAKAVLPAMRERGFGRIVNIASRAALGKELRSAYSASKAGLIGLTRTWALELARDGITVNAVAPGPIDTELFRGGNPADDARTRRIVEGVPVGRLGQPGDIAYAALFFLGEEASFVTGQTLYVCGGLTVGLAPV